MHIDRKNKQKPDCTLVFSPLCICYLVVCLLMVGGRDLARVHNSYHSCFLVCQLFTEASLMTFFLCGVLSLRSSESNVGVEEEEGYEYSLPCPFSMVFVLIWKLLHICCTSSSSKVFGGISMVQSFLVGNHQTLDMEGSCIIKRHLLSKFPGFGTNQLSFCKYKYMWSSCLGKKISSDNYLLTNFLQNYVLLVLSMIVSMVIENITLSEN